MRIVHVFRAPAGGLFRHVRDLVRGQSEAGHALGIVCDASAGGAMAEASLTSLVGQCELGVRRLPMSRLPGFGDLSTAKATCEAVRALKPDILHGHGAKGGLYARLAAHRLGSAGIYTPHGGSLHYSWARPDGAIFLGAERLLRPISSGLLFVCDYERRSFENKIGLGSIPWRVVHNGLWPEEFIPVAPVPDATDLVFVGELRVLKGLGDLLVAHGQVNASRAVTLTIAGAGADRTRFEIEAAKLNLGKFVRFTGTLPARQAFSLGRVFVMPSRAESFPYVIIEAAAAGLPIIATDVGGISEVLPRNFLVPASDPAALAAAIGRELDRTSSAQAPSYDVEHRFRAGEMCRRILDFYGEISAMNLGGAGG